MAIFFKGDKITIRAKTKEDAQEQIRKYNKQHPERHQLAVTRVRKIGRSMKGGDNYTTRGHE